MAETMAPVPAPAGLLAPSSLEDSRWAFTPKDESAYFFMRKNKDDPAVEFAGNKAAVAGSGSAYFFMRKNKDDSAVEFAGNKAAVAGSGLQKSVSWSDFFSKSSEAKLEAAKQAKLEAAKQAKLEAAKQGLVAKLETAKQERKAKLAEGRAKQAAAKVEGKAEPMPSGWVRLPEPVVISSGIERLDEDFIQRVRNRRVLKAPGPIPGLCTKEVEATLNELEDVFMDILRQHDEKGYAVMRVEHLDNGRKRMYRLSEEETANLLV